MPRFVLHSRCIHSCVHLVGRENITAKYLDKRTQLLTSGHRIFTFSIIYKVYGIHPPSFFEFWPLNSTTQKWPYGVRFPNLEWLGVIPLRRIDRDTVSLILFHIGIYVWTSIRRNKWENRFGRHLVSTGWDYGQYCSSFNDETAIDVPCVPYLSET